MMSVLIKGLTKEKVESCFRFAKDGWCIFDMPEIIEVPPHGRLIDADVLMSGVDDGDDVMFVWAITDAPTIIPADAIEELQKRKTGKWELEIVRGDLRTVCSCCKRETGTLYEFNFCPNC